MKCGWVVVDGGGPYQPLLDARLELIHHAEVVVDQAAALRPVTRQVACVTVASQEGVRAGRVSGGVEREDCS